MHYEQSAVEKMLFVARIHESSPVRYVHERVIKKIAQEISELAHVLQHYPHVKYEPLDFVYFTINCINALDEELAIDLATCTNSQGIILLAWLNMVRPTDFQTNLLREVAYTIVNQAWFIKASIEPDNEMTPYIKIIQDALKPFFNTPRRLPVDNDVEKALQLQAYVKQLYAKEGSDGVIAYLKQSRQ